MFFDEKSISFTIRIMYTITYPRTDAFPFLFRRKILRRTFSRPGLEILGDSMNKKDYYWAKYMLIFGFFCISFGTSIFLKTEHAPDEAMRMLIPEYIVSHHTLPNGMEESVRHPLWGFSYALYPYLTAIISSVFMAITSLFTKSAAALLTAARLTSVLSGTGTLIVVFLIGEELFERRESALLGGIFVGFLPQFVFLSCYVNNDSFAVFTVALIIYFWIRGMKSAFCKKDCIGLGAGCGLCALSYYNAYAYLLCSILLFFALMIHFQKPAKEIFVKALAVFAIAFLIGGWFFIRNAVIHDGDLLGMRTSNESAALYAADEYKPENRQTPASEGWSFQQTYLQTPEGRTSNWLFSTVSSFIGSFSYMTVHLPMVLYLLYGALMAFGFLVFLFLGMVPHWFRKKPQLLLFVMLFLACLVTLFMDMYNTYFSDYQSQGRYLMPALVPLMIWIDDGYSSLTAKLPAEWKRASCHLTLLPGTIWLVLFLISYIGFLIPGCCV